MVERVFLEFGVGIESIRRKIAVDSGYVRGEIGWSLAGLEEAKKSDRHHKQRKVSSKSETAKGNGFAPEPTSTQQKAQTYKLACLINAGLARVSRQIAEFILHPLVGADGHRLGGKVLGRRLLADLDGNGGRRGVSRLFLSLPHGFRSWRQGEAGRGSDVVVVDEVVQVHWVRLQWGMFRRLAQLRNPTRDIR